MYVVEGVARGGREECTGVHGYAVQSDPPLPEPSEREGASIAQSDKDGLLAAILLTA